MMITIISKIKGEDRVFARRRHSGVIETNANLITFFMISVAMAYILYTKAGYGVLALPMMCLFTLAGHYLDSKELERLAQ